jgi:hypothetical protein
VVVSCCQKRVPIELILLSAFQKSALVTSLWNASIPQNYLKLTLLKNRVLILWSTLICISRENPLKPLWYALKSGGGAD